MSAGLWIVSSLHAIVENQVVVLHLCDKLSLQSYGFCVSLLDALKDPFFQSKPVPKILLLVTCRFCMEY